jgi:glycogen operon protein
VRTFIAGALDRAPSSPGLSLEEGGAQFVVFSRNASAIDVCLFDQTSDYEFARWRLGGRHGDLFHGFIPAIAPGVRYGLRAQGALDHAAGQAFDASKLLIDPYATRLDRVCVYDPALSRYGIDTASLVPRAIVEAPLSSNAPPSPAQRPSFIYELNVRAFSMMNPAVPELQRGTLAGLAHPASIAHLVRLGVSHVELLPIHAWVDERHLASLGLTNAWGYNPISYMALDPRLAPNGMADLREACLALRAVGIGVLLDVVFNHTGEGDWQGPVLSFRGLDNANYYRHSTSDPGVLVNDTGCGNTLACNRAPVVQLLMESMRRCVEFGGVEGFRFDLATVLGRSDNGFSPEAPLLTAIAQDPLLNNRMLIAEPWDTGPGGYQLGAFPACFFEWNDRYRDDVRRFWRGDHGAIGAFATRISGSQDVFGASHRAPSASVDFIAAHDGFTLRDLVTWTVKRNGANGENNRDGADDNLSWNCGFEGPGDAPLEALRDRDVRALVASVLLSRGTPMMTAGDEFGRTQHGNNNAYCQDNGLMWLDWEHADMELADYVGRLARLRRQLPQWRDCYLSADDGAGFNIPRAQWLRTDGLPKREHDWSDGDCVILLCSVGEGVELARALIAFNRSWKPCEFTPPPREGYGWALSLTSAQSVGYEEGAAFCGELDARSVTLLVEHPVF